MSPSANPPLQEGIREPGNVNILAVNIYSSHHNSPWLLGDVWQNISIYENIKRNYIEGEIGIIDGQDLLTKIPIITGEKIEIEFITPSMNESYKFVGQIVEIRNRYSIGQGGMVYNLKFYSPEWVKNQKVQFSKAYNQMLISDMVKNIFDQYIKPVSDKELSPIPTLDQTSCVVPTMSPFKAINWLCKWAKSPRYRSGLSYVFFEGKNGYYFGPIEALVDSKVPIAQLYKKAIVHTDKTTTVDSFHTISNVTATTPNLLNSVVSGMYASTIKSHDLVLRQIPLPDEGTYNYFKEFPKLTHVDKTPSGENSDAPIHNDLRLGAYRDSFINHVPTHYGAYPLTQNPTRSSSTALVRNSQMSHLFAINLHISIPGNSDRSIGEIIELDLPISAPNLDHNNTAESEELKDKYLSGRYLISGLRHVLNRTDKGRFIHKTELEVSKDAYSQPLPEQTVAHWGG